MDYKDFLDKKKKTIIPTGLDEMPVLHNDLFSYQSDIVTWALRRGKAALFVGTGLGKTFMSIEWARCVYEYTGRNVLILTPLAVAWQFEAEGKDRGIKVKHCNSQDEFNEGICVTNYDKLEKFDLEEFDAVVLDESSILKSFDGKTRSMLIDSFKNYKFKLACTATPAPNDFMELGNHAEFLGICSYIEMLSTWFVHDGGETQKWRLKGHAKGAFWEWVSNWAVNVTMPSDLGYDDKTHILPALKEHEHIVMTSKNGVGGMLFAMEAQTLQERIQIRRDTLHERCEKAIELANSFDDSCIVWCNMNAESEYLAKNIKDAVQIVGSDKQEFKEKNLLGFTHGKPRVLVTKPSIAGYGMNWQHCNKMIFVGLNDSFEQIFQAVRRCWRFGQKREVEVHYIVSSLEGSVLRNIHRKREQYEEMNNQMRQYMGDLTRQTIKGASEIRDVYNPQKDMEIAKWLITQK